MQFHSLFSIFLTTPYYFFSLRDMQGAGGGSPRVLCFKVHPLFPKQTTSALASVNSESAGKS